MDSEHIFLDKKTRVKYTQSDWLLLANRPSSSDLFEAFNQSVLKEIPPVVLFSIYKRAIEVDKVGVMRRIDSKKEGKFSEEQYHDAAEIALSSKAHEAVQYLQQSKIKRVGSIHKV
jgi:hypothetical protein